LVRKRPIYLAAEVFQSRVWGEAPRYDEKGLLLKYFVSPYDVTHCP